ncbi:hypothetical protein WBG78_09325 [Chryseolinea sp. T2]|uniref:hypothetical protein n=1 Tax=Chryseolinea sp. T2 TaxID=3129255 RepID=UPI003077D5A8
MLISFPLQGYGTYSIILSSVHTLCSFAFIILFFRATACSSSIALILAKTALLFCALSSIGPFGLGYFKSNGLEHSNLYRFAIYFYLHFQYNGFFFFGILSLFIKLMEDSPQPHSGNRVRRACYVLVGACVPAYFLSILWSRPSVVFNVIGFLTGAVQLAAFCMILQPIKTFINHAHLSSAARLLYSLSFVALAMKFILQ